MQFHLPVRPATVLAIGLLASVATPALHAAEFTYQYLRFNPVKTRTNGADIQIAEFRFRLGDTLITTPATVTAPTGNSPAGEAPSFVYDRSLISKWFSFARSPLVFSFAEPVTVDNYSFATANDADNRDPVSWTLDGSNEGPGGPWTKIDDIVDFPTTIERRTWLPDFTIPFELPPEIFSFTTTNSVVLNGRTTEFDWSQAGGTQVTITPQPGDVSDVFFTTTTPPSNRDTVYTLSTINSIATRTRTKTVRAVAGGSATYRYVRFTPQLLRLNTGIAIQMADFLFYANSIDEDPGNDIEIFPTAVRTQTGLFSETAVEGPNKLRDGNPATKWFNGTLVPVIFDLGAPTSFDGYRITTGNDSPERDPVRWIMEGSNSDTEGWVRIDDLSTFDYEMPVGRGVTTYVPLPGGSLPPLATFSSDSVKVIAGEPLSLSWTTADAATVSITPLPGSVPPSGAQTIFPTESAVFTLRATSPAGFETVRTIPITVVNSPNATINYPNFDNESGELSLLEFASIMNAFPAIPQPGDVKRLRLTPDVTGRRGTAWFGKRVQVGGGFDTTYSFQLTKPVVDRGADGFSFIIQNSPQGNGAIAVDGENGLPTNSLVVKVDSFINAGEPSNAFVQVRTGTTVRATVNLVGLPGVTINTSSIPVGITDPAATAVPHTIRVRHQSGLLTVWFDGVQIITDLAIDLAAIGAVNSEGKAFVGFGARTGGLSHATDITSWVLTTPEPAIDFRVTAWQIDPASGQGSLTWNSAPGQTYRITGSTDLNGFPLILASGIASGGQETTAPFTFTPTGRFFVRIEQE